MFGYVSSFIFTLQMEMFNTVKYTGSDYQVVPDDGYNSPDYPYYMMDSVSSPAGSTSSSSVDSAFDELAEGEIEIEDILQSSCIILKNFNYE